MSSERSIFFPDVEQDSRVSALYEISDCVRRDAFETIRHAKTGHIGGSSSSVELLTSLYFGGEFRFDVDDPDNPDRDIVLIRGHEGPVRYPKRGAEDLSILWIATSGPRRYATRARC